MKRHVTITNPLLCRLLSQHPDFTDAELYRAESHGHKFNPGEVVVLTGLEIYPEHNGEQVTITAIREDGPRGKAYYVKGAINEIINWVYEYRLKPLKT